MCVPCVAAVPGLGEILIIVVIVLLGVIGLCGKWLVKALPYLGLSLLGIGLGAYRWLSGAALIKRPGLSDDDYWDTEVRQGRPGPRFTRAVRAAGRLAITGVAAGLLWNPLITAIITGSLSVLVSVGAVCGRRDRIITTAKQVNGRARELVRR